MPATASFRADSAATPRASLLSGHALTKRYHMGDADVHALRVVDIHLESVSPSACPLEARRSAWP